ncbi:MAG: hypothetical protein AAFR64_09980 [Pseudomonadota bacterium]
MSMLLIAILLGSSPVFGTVPVRNAELDRAYECLAKGTGDLLMDTPEGPAKDERWRLAMKIVDACDTEIESAANSKEAQPMPSDVSHGGVSRHAALRSEAGYFVDRLIREHFEPKGGRSR